MTPFEKQDYISSALLNHDHAFNPTTVQDLFKNLMVAIQMQNPNMQIVGYIDSNRTGHIGNRMSDSKDVKEFLTISNFGYENMECVNGAVGYYLPITTKDIPTRGTL